MRRICVLLLTSGLLLAGLGSPASGHSGGKAQLFVKQLTVSPSSTPGQYEVSVHLIDYDSGTPMTGYDVSVEGKDGQGNAIALIPLDRHADGHYSTTIASAPGPGALTIRAAGAPGVGEAVPLVVTEQVSFPAESATAPAARTASAARTDSGGGSPAGAIAGVAGVVALLGIVAVLVTNRYIRQ